MKFLFCLLSIASMAPELASADVVLAARTIRSQTVLTANDLVLVPSSDRGAVSRFSDIVGMETRVVLYQGRPITLSDIGPPAIIERNQTVTMIYSNGPISISSAGRSLGRAGVGDSVKVMNLASRNTITGIVNASGEVIVGFYAAREQ